MSRSFVGLNIQPVYLGLRLVGAGATLALAGCAGSVSGLDMSLFDAGDGGLQTGSTDKAGPSSEAAVAATLHDVRRIRAKQGRKAAYEATARAVAKHPKADLLLQERALLALELGRAREAEDLLRKVAEGPRADWRTYSALGAALSSQKRHGDAIEAFQRALKTQPGNATILNNLAMAHALEGQLEKAEELLQSAEAKAQSDAGKSRIQQNRALLAGLSGRVKDYETIVRTGLPKDDVQTNTALLLSRSAGRPRPSNVKVDANAVARPSDAAPVLSPSDSKAKPQAKPGGTRRAGSTEQSAFLLSEPVNVKPLALVARGD